MDENGESQTPWHHEGHPLTLAGKPRLQYQPVIDLGSGQLLGFEALLRWHHPTEGVILPPLLIPWAEANGDIVPLGDWIMVEGCREALKWPPSTQLAVNISVVQLRRAAASAAVIAALEVTGLVPDRLTIEVTEHAMSDEAAVDDLAVIGALGVQLAVDHVGTSWNSFEILRRLAVNTVKIDHSFVMSLEAREGINRMVVETVIQLAHNSGMSTVAEGVETALAAAIVAELDSDAAQGYFFAPPLSEENATTMANVANLRFPLVGPGWSDDDDWPFAGASYDNGGHMVLGGALGSGRTMVEMSGTDARVELDAVDMVDLVLSGPTDTPAPQGPRMPEAAGAPNGSSANGDAAPPRPARSKGIRPKGTGAAKHTSSGTGKGDKAVGGTAASRQKPPGKSTSTRPGGTGSSTSGPKHRRRPPPKGGSGA